ncbi:MAG: hypothetical protein JO185_17955, partial [Acidobacteriaceae bacterium]|nr:hypothetical protein [Acidobacteriaceae bacterium]
MTRRQMGKVTLATAVFSGRNTQAQLANSGSNDESNLDPVRWTLQQYQSAPLQLTFRARTRSEAEAWQQQLRAKLTELIGGFPARTPLHSKTLEIRDFGKYKREKFVFESRPGVAVIGYLLTPSTKTPPHPTMICVPGHGRGVDDIVGIDENGNDRTDKPGYQHDFAIQVVEHNLAAVAIEPLAFGYRRDPISKDKGPTHTACEPAAGSALLF